MTKNSFSQGLFVQMTGMSGAGKSTIAQAVRNELRDRGYRVEIIDGDEYRENLCHDLGFSDKDRVTNIQRLSFVGKMLSRNGVIVLMAAINPFESVRQRIAEENPLVRTVYVRCDWEELVVRDTKGLYARAMLPEGDGKKLHAFTGIASSYEEPVDPDLTLDTQVESVRECVERLLDLILKEVN